MYRIPIFAEIEDERAKLESSKTETLIRLVITERHEHKTIMQQMKQSKIKVHIKTKTTN